MGTKAEKIVKKIKHFRKNRKSNLNAFLICASIVMIWRGISNLLDIYLFPNNPVLSNLICIILGTLILMIDDGKLGELEGEPPYTKK